MPQLKIVCLAHPALWADVVKDSKKINEKILSLKEKRPKPKSWLDLGVEFGSRRGIFKLEFFDDSTYFAKIAYEREIKEDYSSIEKILEEEGCLPEEIKLPKPLPTASKASLFLDLKEGVCYIYTDTMAPPIETMAEILVSLGDDCNLPCKALKVFEWEEELVTIITDIATSEGYQPYKMKADLENVKITAEGDFADNNDWERIKNSIDLGKWDTIAYKKRRDGRYFIFGITKARKKNITMPNMGDLPPRELYQNILDMRILIEKALGSDIRRYCFPENIRPITQFFEEKKTKDA